MSARVNYRRQDLIKLCQDAVVPIKKWGDRDCSDAHRQLGEAWALLKAGCPFKILTDKDLKTDRNTIWVEISFTDFSGFEANIDHNASETFYIPTRERLNNNKGKDWY